MPEEWGAMTYVCRKVFQIVWSMVWVLLGSCCCHRGHNSARGAAEAEQVRTHTRPLMTAIWSTGKVHCRRLVQVANIKSDIGTVVFLLSNKHPTKVLELSSVSLFTAPIKGKLVNQPD